MNNKNLIDNLKKKGTIKSKKIEKVMLKIKRSEYCMCDSLINRPNPILKNQTMSAPHIHAMTLQILSSKLKPGAHVLDVGCGTGYLTACFASLLNVNKNPKSKVVGIDIYKDIINLSKNNIKSSNPEFLPLKYGGKNINNNVYIICANGWNGYKKFEKYDAINVGASADKIPVKLLEQLKNGGKMLIPIKNSYQIITKKNSGYKIEEVTKVRFVPLISGSIKNRESCL